MKEGTQHLQDCRKIKGVQIMKIRTFTDFKNLKKGTWISDYTGTYEVVTPYAERNSDIGLSEVIFADDESDEYTLGTENPHVTFNDIRGAEII
jgi:hypothetical protein